MIITLYDVASGEIRRSVYCPDSMAPFQVGSGEGYVLGAVSADLAYISGGVVVYYSENERSNKANKPAHVSSWDNPHRQDWTRTGTKVPAQRGAWAEA